MRIRSKSRRFAAAYARAIERAIRTWRGRSLGDSLIKHAVRTRKSVGKRMKNLSSGARRSLLPWAVGVSMTRTPRIGLAGASDIAYGVSADRTVVATRSLL